MAFLECFTEPPRIHECNLRVHGVGPDISISSRGKPLGASDAQMKLEAEVAKE